MRVQFNTGRMYQSDGQRIVAEYREGEIIFNDISRMIAGVIVQPSPPASLAELQRLTLSAYDHSYFNYATLAQVAGLKWEETK